MRGGGGGWGGGFRSCSLSRAGFKFTNIHPSTIFMRSCSEVPFARACGALHLSQRIAARAVCIRITCLPLVNQISYMPPASRGLLRCSFECRCPQMASTDTRLQHFATSQVPANVFASETKSAPLYACARLRNCLLHAAEAKAGQHEQQSSARLAAQDDVDQRAAHGPSLVPLLLSSSSRT